MKNSFKKTIVKLVLLTDIDMLLMLEKGIRGGICHSIYPYAKANKKYIKDYDKNKKSLYLINNFEWIKDNSQFNEDFIKSYNEGYFREVDVQYTKKLHELHNNL